jgi:hypothetical protein
MNAPLNSRVAETRKKAIEKTKISCIFFLTVALDGDLEGLERFVFYVNFAPDLGVDHDLAEWNIQILHADGVSATVTLLSKIRDHLPVKQ